MGALDDRERVRAADAPACRAWLEGHDIRTAGVRPPSVRGGSAAGVGYDGTGEGKRA